jgi:hypothetical protein
VADTKSGCVWMQVAGSHSAGCHPAEAEDLVGRAGVGEDGRDGQDLVDDEPRRAGEAWQLLTDQGVAHDPLDDEAGVRTRHGAVGVVNGEGLPVRLREQRDPSRTQNPADLKESGLGVGHVLEHAVGVHPIDARGRERQCVKVRMDDVHLG